MLEELDNGQRLVVFLDELSWLDTPGSDSESAIEIFWNSWGSWHDNVMVIICDSNVSVIFDKVANNTRGMYGRSTCHIYLRPLSLAHCREFYHALGIEISDYEILQNYMIFGGVPYYMDLQERVYEDVTPPRKPSAQNALELFWGENAYLRDEFNRMIDLSFSYPEDIKKIIKFIDTCHKGFHARIFSKV